jgi:hypothetical protein
MSNFSTPATLTAEQYIQTRFKDYCALSQEIAEARKGNEADLGYCKLVDNRQVVTETQTHTFKTFTDACAFILRRFW